MARVFGAFLARHIAKPGTASAQGITSSSKIATQAESVPSHDADELKRYCIMVKKGLDDRGIAEVERRINEEVASNGHWHSAQSPSTEVIYGRHVSLFALWAQIPPTKPDLVEKIRQIPNVVSIDPATVYTYSDAAVDLSSQLLDPYHVERLYNRVPPPQCTKTETKTLAFVIDSGIDSTHPEFRPSQVIHLDNNSFSNDKDEEGHGTSVGSIIAGRHVGIAPGHEQISVKLPTLPNGQIEDRAIVNGIKLVTNYLRLRKEQGLSIRSIVNLSLGGPTNPAVLDAVDDPLQFPVLIIGASGNNSKTQHYSARERFPGSHHAILIVGAANKQLHETDFSCFGHRVDLFAFGHQVSTADTRTGGYVKRDGTSFASPQVAGLALQSFALHSEASPSLISSILRRSAKYSEVSL